MITPVKEYTSEPDVRWASEDFAVKSVWQITATRAGESHLLEKRNAALNSIPKPLPVNLYSLGDINIIYGGGG